MNHVALRVNGPENPRKIQFRNQCFNLARRFKDAIIQATYVASRYESIAEIGPAKQQRFSCSIDNLLALGMSKLRPRGPEGRTEGKKSYANDFGVSENSLYNMLG